MWKTRQLDPTQSPMKQLMANAKSVNDINLVIYHLGENHVECATVRDIRPFTLNDTICSEFLKGLERTPQRGVNCVHAILAFNMADNTVSLVDAAPELNACSAIMLCVSAELMEIATRGIGKPHCVRMEGEVKQVRHDEYGEKANAHRLAHECLEYETHRDYIPEVVDDVPSDLAYESSRRGIGFLRR